ncbi:MAG: DNA/RNA nuclease SfsA [Xenococcaceae cyanobacterium]
MLYTYPPLHAGILLKRYKRFLADIELETGEVVTAHCANTGPMTGICTPGSRVLVSYSSVTTRKLPYTWEAIEVNDNEPTWVIVNTALPNRIVKLALAQKLFPELGSYSQIRCEVPYGADRKSRVDFLLTGDRPIYIEVKSTTWAQQRLAMFPDTETIRGQKHLRELSALLPQARAVMFYAINRGDCTQFAPGDAADLVYGQLLREAMQLGLEVLPCRFEVTPVGVRYLGLADLKI